MNKVYVHNVHGQVSTGQKAIGTILLSSIKNRHFSGQLQIIFSKVIIWVSVCVLILGFDLILYLHLSFDHAI